MFEDKHLQNDLAYLKSNFCFLIQAITNLEKSTLSLDEVLKIILNVKDKLYKCKGRVAEFVKTKMDFILKMIKGFKILLKILSIINVEYEEEEDVNTPGQIASLNMLQYPYVMWKGDLVNMNLFYVQIAGRS